ncbi:MAG: hypothetical protein ACLP7Q_15345 [Isosphaeraceae bacterium]
MKEAILNRLDRAFAFVVVAILVFSAGADDPKKHVDAGGLSFEAPQSWKMIPSRSPMRKAQLQVEAAAGDEFPALLVVYAFPGGAGSVDANVKRWQDQFRDADGNPPKIESKTVRGKNVEVTRVETAGHYKPSAMPGMAPEPDRENARLLGAIVVTERVGYFLKMVGPDKTMTLARPAFDELLSSIEVAEK